MVKEDYVNAIATLLSLDSQMTRDLMKLKIGTVATMYNNYNKNAIQVNNYIEMIKAPNKVNRGLPPVNIKIKVKVDDKWKIVIRDQWIEKGSDHVTFTDPKTQDEFAIHRNKIEWQHT